MLTCVCQVYCTIVLRALVYYMVCVLLAVRFFAHLVMFLSVLLFLVWLSAFFEGRTSTISPASSLSSLALVLALTAAALRRIKDMGPRADAGTEPAI